MKVTVHIWRQSKASTNGDFKQDGKMVRYEVPNASPDMSFLEMLDILNEQFKRVLINTHRLITLVVATLINRHCLIVLAQLGHLLTPCIPIVRKTVDHDDRLAFSKGHVNRENNPKWRLTEGDVIERAGKENRSLKKLFRS